MSMFVSVNGKRSESCYFTGVGPDDGDGDEADCYEEDVDAGQQAVNDAAHFHPLI